MAGLKTETEYERLELERAAIQPPVFPLDPDVWELRASADLDSPIDDLRRDLLPDHGNGWWILKVEITGSRPRFHGDPRPAPIVGVVWARRRSLSTTDPSP